MKVLPDSRLIVRGDITNEYDFSGIQVIRQLIYLPSLAATLILTLILSRKGNFCFGGEYDLFGWDVR